MKEYTYNSNTIRVRGVACHEKIEAATITFLKKIELHKQKQKQKEQQRNGNIDQSRNI
jgi:hypothetical protein